MGEGLVQSVTERMFQYGILGILVLVFGIVIWFLWNDSKKERKAYQGQIATLTEKCATDKKELIEKYEKERDEIYRRAEEVRDVLLKKIDESQVARISDAKGFQSDTVKLTQQVTLATASANTLMEGQRDATLEVRGALREQSEELRNLASDVRERFPRRG